MLQRPLACTGVAFLLTVATALFYPRALYLLLPCVVFWFLLAPNFLSAAARPAAVGCALAIICCGIFAFRWQQAAALEEQPSTLTGTVLAEGGQQLLLTQGKDFPHVVLLQPRQYDLTTGQTLTVTGRFSSPVVDSNSYLISGGILSQLVVESIDIAPVSGEEPPFWVWLALSQQRLCQRLAQLSPTTSTAVTLGVLFSYNRLIPPDLRQAFSDSGMAHLLAVSGLHLSILVGLLSLLVRRLGGGPLWQLAWGSVAVGVVSLGAGFSPSVLRAGVMCLLTLLALAVGRHSDGLTSLAATAMALVFCFPTLLGDLSFQLSFLATLGILTLAPRISAALLRLVEGQLSPRYRPPRWLILATAVSLAAQLATAPVVAAVFAHLPLLGVLVNLVAIPLCYPILLFGLGAVAALLAGAPLVAGWLLLPANLCSWLLAALALLTARVPLASLGVLFPSEWLALALGLTLPLLLLLPRRLLWRRRALASACTLFVLSLGWCAYASRAGVVVAASSQTGSVVVATRRDAVLLDYSRGDYPRELDRRLLEQLGHAAPAQVLFPGEAHPRQQQTLDLYGLPEDGGQLPSGFAVRQPQPHLLEIEVGGIKLVKCDAVYGTIERYEPGTLLCDLDGQLLRLGGGGVLRLPNGLSLYRIIP